MTKLDQILQQVRAELGTDFISADIVGLDGLSIAGTSVESGLDSSSSSARFAMVMKLASKVAEKLNIGSIEDTLASTDTMLILTRQLGDGSYFWQMTVPRDATLGTVRMVMNEYADKIWDAIPH